MKAIKLAVLFLISAEAAKIRNEQFLKDEGDHYPKNLDDETITALEISEAAGDESRQQFIKESQMRAEEEYKKKHPKQIQDQIISTPE